MGEDSENDEGQAVRSPLVPIGLTVLGILILPMFLYSTGPEGPIKEGDVVFSTGRYRVNFVEPTKYNALGYQSFCVLEPRDQLLITARLASRTDGSLIARPLGLTDKKFPFCPPKAELVVHSHQATLQADTWGSLKETLANIFSNR
ncbi:hypothetical protein [Candidatus Nitrospira salsa]